MRKYYWKMAWPLDPPSHRLLVSSVPAAVFPVSFPPARTACLPISNIESLVRLRQTDLPHFCAQALSKPAKYSHGIWPSFCSILNLCIVCISDCSD